MPLSNIDSWQLWDFCCVHDELFTLNDIKIPPSYNDTYK